MTQEQSPNDQPRQEPTPEPTSVEELQAQNQQLRQRVEAMEAHELSTGQSLEQLEKLQQENQNLRRSYTSAALDQAIRQAADKLGISHETASLHAHRFQCMLDENGSPQITPSPTELLADEIKSNPLLATSEAQRKRNAEADAATAGLIDPESLDAGQLLAQLDRSPAEKGRFIARHGAETYLKMAQKARVAESSV